MKSKLAKQVFHLSSRKNTQTFLFAKVYPFLFGGIKSSKILLTLNTKTSLFCSVIKSSPILLSSLIFLLFFSCRSDKTPISTTQAKITISADYVAVTEVWLKVELRNSPDDAQVKIWRDTTIAFTGSFSGTDTTVVDTGLLPAHSYTYKSAIMENNKQLVNGAPLKITTMDTTSHNFTWEIITFGEGGISGSTLYDVAIVNENDIWAVGEIHTAETDTFDSTGNWVPPYNAVHWDGQQWNLRRFVQANGNTILSIRGLCYFSENNIWLAAGSIYHWNGMNTTLSYLRDINTTETVESLWASSPANIYGVGNAGLIAHYNGQRWRKIESGTNIDLRDVWGTSPENVWMSGYDSGYFNSILLRWDGKKTNILWEEQNPNNLPYFFLIESLWAGDDKYFFVVNNTNVFRHSQENLNEVSIEPVHLSNSPSRIRGSAINNIFVVGNDAMIWHFNGQKWYHFSGMQNNRDVLNSVAVMDNIVCAVGKRSFNIIEKSGIIYLGRR